MTVQYHSSGTRPTNYLKLSNQQGTLGTIETISNKASKGMEDIAITTKERSHKTLNGKCTQARGSGFQNIHSTD
jgi:hypothetical protein